MSNSMLYSFVLSQILGLFLFIMAVILWSKRTFYRKILMDLKANDPVVFISSIFGLLIGIVLVDTHSIWLLKPRLIVTIACWIIFLKSLLWLAMPERMIALTKRICSGSGYNWGVLFLAIFGLLITVRGFQAVIIGDIHLLWY
ncbi:MAG: hypothetical protein Q8R83_07865 [Legionellaceae bacterium]|nr:hypothetical protein [Legionellaceae bacterium]